GADLLHVALAHGLAGLLPGLGEDREEDGCENRDDCDDNEQLYEGKPSWLTHGDLLKRKEKVAKRSPLRTRISAAVSGRNEARRSAFRQGRRRHLRWCVLRCRRAAARELSSCDSPS